MTCCVVSDHKSGEVKLINSEAPDVGKGLGVGEGVKRKVGCESNDDSDL